VGVSLSIIGGSHLCCVPFATLRNIVHNKKLSLCCDESSLGRCKCTSEREREFSSDQETVLLHRFLQLERIDLIQIADRVRRAAHWFAEAHSLKPAIDGGKKMASVDWFRACMERS
jgi:hypothetical protein